ncbi:MAG: CHAT domain-containing protein [Bryobacterales bacterium]|nr:CHAT domain-containing protein [Bryobacterales bacterium]
MDFGTDLLARRWSIIRFRLEGPFLLVSYRDSSVEQSGFGQRTMWTPSPDLGAIGEPLKRLAGEAVQRPGPHANGPYPVAVYYSLPPRIELPELESAFLEWMESLPFHNQLQPVRLSRAPRVQRELLHLPLRILVDPEASPLIADFTSQWWLHEADVPEHGVQIETLDARKGDLELTLRTGAFTVLLTGNLRDATQALRRLPVEARPRLLICAAGCRDRLPSLAGVAVLSLDLYSATSVLTRFLLGVSHDLPLHEALKAARRWMPTGPRQQLLADPASNQSLRMREALIAAKREAFRVRSLATDFYAGGFGLAPIVHPPHWNSVYVLEDSTPDKMFFQETTGLGPMARLAATFHKFYKEQNLETPLAEPGPRALDAALLRLESEPWYTPVETKERLQAGAAYDLRIHIGPRLPGSIVVGEVTGIDQLIGVPDQESGHLLNISVQAKDFHLEGTRSFQVKLPRTGSTEPVYFRVRAPKQHGAAELRIYVHHRNHLVQSFLLTGEVSVADQVAASAHNLLTVRQEFAQSEEFTNLDDLRPRALFLGLNQGQGNTHQIGFVADSVSDEVNLSAAAFDQSVQELRQELRNATLAPGGVRTYTPVPKGQPPGSDAAAALLHLARKGSAVYDALLGTVGSAARASLVRMQKASGETIQIVRFDPRSAFPWAMLYDWSLPPHRFQAPDPPVCLGSTLDANGQPVDCAHTSTDRVVCVRGFWGVRHYVEELLPQLRNVQLKIQKPANDPVRLVASSTLPEATQLDTRLKSGLGLNSVVQGPWVEKDLLDLLWSQPAARPAVLVVLGHLQKQDIPSQPVGPRVELQPGSEWITLQEVQQRIRVTPDQWGDPRTILILAPCESAATDDQTLNDFVTAFSTAGAGAILGTQVEVGAAQATDFAQHITERLWNGAKLGVAMQEVRSELVMGGDPGGFLFQSFGHVDLELQ